MRALIAGIVHESSTIMLDVAEPTGLDDFDVHDGSALLTEFAATNTIVGGYLASCRRNQVTVLPALHARAEPGAAVDPNAYGVLEERLLTMVRAAGQVDLVLLDLHGAGTLTSGNSLDLALVRRLREVTGPGVVLAATVDLHANVPDELVPILDVLVGFQDYPHTDMAARAELAADIAIGQAGGRLRPVVRKLTLPMLLPPSSTLSGAAAEVRELVRQQELTDGVLACTILHGYPYADTPHACAAVVTVTDASEALADTVNRAVGDWLWNSRERFRVVPVTPAEAVAEALAAPEGPVIIGDATDNPGCGALGDSTYLLSALVDSGARACLATLHDPAAVAAAIAAGVDTEISLELGGRHGWASGPPLVARAHVRAITDGRVVQQSMRRGKTLEFGASARLQIGPLDVIVSSARRQVLDPEILVLHGMPPDRYQIVAVKSVTHFRAGFASVGSRLLVADAPGPFTRDITALPRRGPTASLWPMRESATAAS